MDYKQVIIVRKDLKMRTGKACAQAAHASMGAILKKARENWLTKMLSFFGIKALMLDLTDPQMGPWLSGRFKKITVYVNSEEELLSVYHRAESAGLICSLIQDAGLTEFGGVPTYTAVAVGPDVDENVNVVTGKLPLF